MLPVLIVGAGPTGLTLAVDLARRGIECRIVDRARELPPGSRGRGMQPRTQEVLDDLGVVDEVHAHDGIYPPMRTYQDGAVVWEGRMGEYTEPGPHTPYPNGWMIPQWRTCQILRDRLAEFGVPVEFGTGLGGFHQDPDGVTATLVNARGTQRVRTAYLVGADGGHSAVRHTLGVGFLGETSDEIRMLVGDVRADGLDRGYWHVWRDSGDSRAFVGLCPMAGTDSFQFTAPVLTGEVPDLSDVDTLRRFFAEHSGRSGIRLHQPTWMSVWRPNTRLAERFRDGRVFLAGDAAHVHPPTGGLGLNTGVQDAYNLGWKLGAVLHGRAAPSLLDSYQQERLPVAADALGISTDLLRQTIDDVESGTPFWTRRGERTNQLGIGYRGGPLSHEDRAEPGRVRAGDRAPDAPCADPTGTAMRLFDVFRGPHHTLLAFGDGHTGTISTLRAAHPGLRAYQVPGPGSPATDDALLDTGGHIRRGYDATDGTLMLVRPDGYLAVCADRAHSVQDYLRMTDSGYRPASSEVRT